MKETPLITVSPKSKENLILPEQVNDIIQRLATNFEIPANAAFIAIILLILRGCSNQGCPATTSVEVCGKEISKRDLLYAYQLVTKNTHLRRLAESMALEIGKYAEANGLSGDLARKLNTRSRSETGDDLTPKELAWASSFCQGIPELKTLAGEKLCKLLAEDYNSRFNKSGKKQNPTALWFVLLLHRQIKKISTQEKKVTQKEQPSEIQLQLQKQKL